MQSASHCSLFLFLCHLSQLQTSYIREAPHIIMGIRAIIVIIFDGHEKTTKLLYGLKLGPKWPKFNVYLLKRQTKEIYKE